MSEAGGDRQGTSGEQLSRARHGRAAARRVGVMLAIAAVVVAADQVTKSLAVSRLAGRSVHVIGPFAFELSYNTGVAFSIGTGLSLPIVIIVVIAVVLVAWFGRTVPSTSAAVGVGMILGGAIGNLADRIFRGHHGAVVDFVYSGFWPTFNLADASIVCGCAVVALALWRANAPGTSLKAEPDHPK